MTVGNVVDKARRRLGDTSKTGWSDDSLIDLVNQAQKDIALSGHVYKRVEYIPLIKNSTIYSLPRGLFQINRIEYRDRPLKLLTREDQSERYMPAGLYAVKSDLDITIVELSRPVTDLGAETNYIHKRITGIESESFVGALVSPPEGVVVDSNIDVDTGRRYINLSAMEGTVIGVTYDYEFSHDETNYGDISDLNSDADYIDIIDELGIAIKLHLSPPRVGDAGLLTSVGGYSVQGLYGICTDCLPQPNYLKLFYSAIPNEVYTLHNALSISELWEQAMVHYVVGKARQYDNDESNYALGKQELSLYDKEIKKAKKLAARAYSSTISEVKETIYRRI